MLCRLPSSYVWLCSQCLRSQPAPCHPPVHTLPHPHTLLSNQTRMSTLKPFIFGGIASLTAEVGKFFPSELFAYLLSSPSLYTTHPLLFPSSSPPLSSSSPPLPLLLTLSPSLPLTFPPLLLPLTGTFPLDTTKTRLQVQGQTIDELCRQTKYRGMTHALFRISQEEGVRALYKG